MAGTKKQPTFDDLRRKPRQRRDVEIPTDPDAAAELRAAQAELDEADKHLAALKVAPVANNADSRAEHKAKLAATLERRNEWCAERDARRKRVDESTVTLRFSSIGRRAYDALIALHPATEEQDANHRENFGGQPAPYDAETFSVALIAASCVEPKMTEDEVAELQAEWNVTEFLPLWMAALEVNQASDVGLGKAFGRTTG